ncbi:MAG: YqeG family HAD IIIA-type phosphatase [Clostridia bacterium]|nr:YqeG family HAD IIIA-type phosphatase [Clostridia bacterium]
MFQKLLPTKVLPDIYSLTPEFLGQYNIKALILDIDNTLVTYDDPKPTLTVAKWLDELHAAGIATAFVSNNHEERVASFCEGLGCYFHADAGKPSRRFLREAMAHMGTDVTNTASVGDQLFTDVWAAGRAGMKAFYVPPIKDKKTLFFRAKRALEKPLLRIYYSKEKQ